MGFVSGGRANKISVEGGAAVTLCDAPSGRGASWGEDGSIIAALGITGVLSRIPSAGGAPTPVTKLNPGERTHRWPHHLPGGQSVLFTANGTDPNYEDANIQVVSLKTGEQKTAQRGGFDALLFELAREPVRAVFHAREYEHHVHGRVAQQMERLRSSNECTLLDHDGSRAFPGS